MARTHHDLTTGEIEAVAYLTALNANKAVVTDVNGLVVSSAATATEVDYLSGVTSSIQTQLDDRANKSLSNLSSVAINTTLLPGANDGAALGSGTLSFSDLFLAVDGVINWGNGLANITADSGGYMTVTFADQLNGGVEIDGSTYIHTTADITSLTITSEGAAPFAALNVNAFSADTGTRNVAYFENVSPLSTGTTVVKIVNKSTGYSLDVTGSTYFTGGQIITENFATSIGFGYTSIVYSDTGSTTAANFFYRARGSQTVPTATQLNDIIGGFYFRAFDGAAGSYNGDGTANWNNILNSVRFAAVATQTHTSTAHGTGFVLSLTPNNSITRADKFVFNQDGSLTLAATAGTTGGGTLYAGAIQSVGSSDLSTLRVGRLVNGATVLELGNSDSTVPSIVAIDFHYCDGVGTQAGQDYNGRIQNNIDKQLTCSFAGGSGTFYVNGVIQATSSSIATAFTCANDASDTIVRANTVDGTDTRRVQIAGGGLPGVTRGAYNNLFGNEHATNPGCFDLLAGNVTGGHVRIYTGNAVLRVTYEDGGDILYATNQMKSNTSMINMIDADNNGTGSVWSVRANGVASDIFSVAETGALTVTNTVTVTAQKQIVSATTANNYIDLYDATGNMTLAGAGSVNYVIDSDANTTATSVFAVYADGGAGVGTARFIVREDGAVTVGSSSGTGSGAFYCGALTATGTSALQDTVTITSAKKIVSGASADNYLDISNASGNLILASRGSLSVFVDSDNNSTANTFNVIFNAATSTLIIEEDGAITAGNTAKTGTGTGYFGTINTTGIVGTAASTFDIVSNTADTADNKYIRICGGGAVGNTRGGAIYISGDDAASNAGTVQIAASNRVGSQVEIYTAASTLRTAWKSTGDIVFSAPTTAHANVQFTSGAAPTTPTSGDIWHDSTQHSLMFAPATLGRSIMTTYFTKYDTTTVANTVTETSVIGNVIGSATMAANTWAIGKELHFRFYGYLGTTGTPTLRIQVKLGGVVVFDTTATSLSASISGNEFIAIEGIITCQSIGATGTFMTQCKPIYHTGSGASGNTILMEGINTTTATIDTTANTTFDLTTQWGTANASNTLTITNADAFIVN